MNFGPDAEGGGRRACVADAGSGRPCSVGCAGLNEQLDKRDRDNRQLTVMRMGVKII